MMKPAEFAAACGMELATLRAWERRYGFPAPQRTKGGHRRYSQDLVASVLEAQRLIEQGWRVPAAVTRAADSTVRLANGETGALLARTERWAWVQTRGEQPVTVLLESLS